MSYISTIPTFQWSSGCSNLVISRGAGVSHRSALVPSRINAIVGCFAINFISGIVCQSPWVNGLSSTLSQFFCKNFIFFDSTDQPSDCIKVRKSDKLPIFGQQVTVDPPECCSG